MIVAVMALCGAMTAGFAGMASAQGNKAVKGVGEIYEPTIWVDPDGCEHWVMDDGAEGFMTPHVRRDGTPVCRRIKACGTLAADQFFADGSATISAAGRQRLAKFFRNQKAEGFIVSGHTDSAGASQANRKLSTERAAAVAAVGQAVGAKIISVKGYGELQPRASNASETGRAQNRRVDIVCVN